MTEKRENPYQRLKRLAQAWHDKVVNRRTVFMFRYAEARTASYSLNTLLERTKAANQLGFDVEVRAAGNALEIYYVEKIERAPWELRQ